MASLISNDYHVEAEALSTSWPVRRMAAELPQDLRLALLDNVDGSIGASFMNRANARFRQLATRDEQGLLVSIGGVERALRLALLDLAMGVWNDLGVANPDRERFDGEVQS